MFGWGRQQIPERAATAASLARRIALLPPHERLALPSSPSTRSSARTSDSFTAQRPWGEQAEELDERFYEETFDPVRHALSQLPEDEDGTTLQYLGVQSGKKLLQLDAITERLSHQVMQHYEEMVAGMQLVTELERDLAVVNIICRNGRRHLSAASAEVHYDLVVTANVRKKQVLLEMLPTLRRLQSIVDTKQLLDATLEDGNYAKALRMCSQCLVMLEECAQLKAAQDINRGIEEWLASTVDRVDALLLATCQHFDSKSFATVVDAYAVMDDAGALAEKAHTLYAQCVVSETYDVLKSFLYQNASAEGEDPVAAQKRSRLPYNELCMQLPDASFRACLLKTLEVLFDLLCSYHAMMTWHHPKVEGKAGASPGAVRDKKPHPWAKALSLPDAQLLHTPPVKCSSTNSLHLTPAPATSAFAATPPSAHSLDRQGAAAGSSPAGGGGRAATPPPVRLSSFVRHSASLSAPSSLDDLQLSPPAAHSTAAPLLPADATWHASDSPSVAESSRGSFSFAAAQGTSSMRAGANENGNGSLRSQVAGSQVAARSSSSGNLSRAAAEAAAAVEQGSRAASAAAREETGGGAQRRHAGVDTGAGIGRVREGDAAAEDVPGRAPPETGASAAGPVPGRAPTPGPAHASTPGPTGRLHANGSDGTDSSDLRPSSNIGLEVGIALGLVPETVAKGGREGEGEGATEEGEGGRGGEVAAAAAAQQDAGLGMASKMRAEAAAGVRKVLERGRKTVWELAARRVSALLSADAMCNASAHQFLQELNLLNRFILAGEAFSGAEAVGLRAKMAKQSENYFYSFHRQNLEVLRMMFERETWQRVPPGSVATLNLAGLSGIGGAGGGFLSSPHLFSGARGSKDLHPPPSGHLPESRQWGGGGAHLLGGELTDLEVKSSFADWISAGNPFAERAAAGGNAAVAGSDDMAAAQQAANGDLPYSQSTAADRDKEGGNASTPTGGRRGGMTVPVGAGGSGALANGRSSNGGRAGASGGIRRIISQPQAGRGHAHMAGADMATVADVDDDDDDDEDEENEELLADFIDEDSQRPSKRGGGGSGRARSGSSRLGRSTSASVSGRDAGGRSGGGGGGNAAAKETEGFGLTGSAVSVARFMDRYARLMQTLMPIAPQVFRGLCQVFDLYLLTVFRVFGHRDAFSAARPLGSTSPSTYLTPRLRATLTRVVQSLEEFRLMSAPPGGAATSSSSSSSLGAAGAHTSIGGGAGGGGGGGVAFSMDALISAAPLGPNQTVSSSNLYGLRERCVAMESIEWLADLLQRCRPRFQALLPHAALPSMDHFFSRTVEAVPDLKEHVYKVLARLLLNLSGHVEKIGMVRWEPRELGTEHNAYVELLLNEFKLFAHRLAHSGVPREVQEEILVYGVDEVAEVLVEGYSRVRRCTNEGRALMSLDLQVLLSVMQTLLPAKAKPNMQIVENYIKAFYLPETEYLHWAQTHSEYSKSQIIGLINLVATMNNWKRKTRAEILERVESSDLR